MCIEIIKLIISILTLLALVVYAYFTYLIVRDTQEPFVSFMLSQVKLSTLGFSMVNRSKVEVEVLSKLWAKINSQIFQFKKGFYADDTNYILQPFTTGGGGFNLNDLTNDDEVKLEDFVKQNNIRKINFKLQIKYRKVESKKWKISSPQNFSYNFKTKAFWLDV